MEQFLNIFKSNMSDAFSTNSTFGILSLVLTIAFVFRARIKTFLTLAFGQKTFIDDGAISRWQNRDSIFHNRRILLTKNINIKSFLTIYGIFITSLISPMLSAILFAVFMYIDSKIKMSNFQDFKYFEDEIFSDKFGIWLNNNINKIDFLTQNLIVFGIGSITLSIITNSLFAGILGVVSLSIFLIVGLFLYYNVDSYKVNLKLNSYFKLTRLLSASLIGNSQVLMFFFILTITAYYNNSQIANYLTIISVMNLSLILLFKSELGKATKLAKEHFEIENKDYLDLAKLASQANLKSMSRGTKWTTPLQLKEFSENAKNKNGIVLDNYAFYHEVLNRSVLRRNPLLTKALTNVQMRVNHNEFRKLIILLGDMGSGKTQWINNVVVQNIKEDFKFYNFHVYNDVKGDFTAQFYRPEKDIIISLFDKRASCWCVFSEMNYNIEAGNLFVNNVFTTLAGGKKEFFESRAIQIIGASIQEAYFETDNNIDAWNLFFEKIKDIELLAKEEDNGTNQSVMAVVQIALEILEILRFQICIEKRNTFVLSELVYKKDVQIFLLNNENYRTRLTPYLNGFFGSFVGAVMQKDDRVALEENILVVIDEALTFFAQIEEGLGITLLTTGRSKGICCVSAMQTLPESGKISELIDSSYYAMIIFPVNKEKTLGNITGKLGSQEGLTATMSPLDNQKVQRHSKGGGQSGDIGASLSIFTDISNSFFDSFSNAFNKKSNKNFSLGESKFLFDKDIQSMPLYHHLTIIPKAELKCFDDFEIGRAFRSLVFDGNIDCLEFSEDVAKEVGMVYLGYTHPNNLDFGNAVFEAWNMKDFYLSKNKKVKAPKQVQILTDEELFTHYYKLKFVLDENEIETYCKTNRLDLENLENMFYKIEENAEKIANFRNTHSKDEIQELADAFFSIDDDKERFKFVLENDLFGCVLEGLLIDDEVTSNEE